MPDLFQSQRQPSLARNIGMPPIVRIVQEDIDVVSRREIDSNIFPRREREERPVGSINVLAA